MTKQKLQIIILAAGKGTRMNSELPKALLPIKGRPMISYLLRAIDESGVCDHPAIVVGYESRKVKEVLGDDYIYVHQDVQHGTGHAVECTKEMLEGNSEHVLVLYADQPFIKPETIHHILEVHEKKGSVMTMATIKVDDFSDWRAPFDHFGRVKRDEKGNVERIVEFKDTTEEDKKIMEFSPTYFCFHAEWLWNHITRLENKNAQEEYYLTDLLEMVIGQGHDVVTVSVDAKEALGANTLEQLRVLEGFIQ